MSVGEGGVTGSVLVGLGPVAVRFVGFNSNSNAIPRRCKRVRFSLDLD